MVTGEVERAVFDGTSLNIEDRAGPSRNPGVRAVTAKVVTCIGDIKQTNQHNFKDIFQIKDSKFFSVFYFQI